MEELIREINGIREQLGWHDWSHENAEDMLALCRPVMQICDLVVALVRSIESAHVAPHNHLHQNANVTSRTFGDVIQKGY